jgi:hypothetical protein
MTSKRSRGTIRAGGANLTTSAKTTTGLGTGQPDLRSATAPITRETIFART